MITLRQIKKAVVGASVTLDSTPIPGSLIVVGFTVFSASQPVLVTDNQGNTYARAVDANDSGSQNWATIFYVPNCAASGTFTVSTTQGDGTMIVAEYQHASASTVDLTSAANGSSTQPLATISPANHLNELLVGVVYTDGSGLTQVPLAGWSMRANETDNSTNERQAFTDRIAGLGTYTAGLSSGYTGAWAVAVASFVPVNRGSINVSPGLRPHPFSPGIAR